MWRLCCIYAIACASSRLKSTLTPRPPKKPPFVLPKPGGSNDRVIDYLMQRGIGLALLQSCINTGRLYEDERHNCCFVGFNREGIPRYAMLRSSSPGSTFLREAEGSDKRYSFSMPPQEQSDTLYLFESAIDCLSFVELQRMENEGWELGNYLSLSGVYQPKQELSETPLPIALMQFLQDNPHVNHVALCLDNDEAGRTAALAINALLPERYTTELLPAGRGQGLQRATPGRKEYHSTNQDEGRKKRSFKFQGGIRKMKPIGFTMNARLQGISFFGQYGRGDALHRTSKH